MRCCCSAWAAPAEPSHGCPYKMGGGDGRGDSPLGAGPGLRCLLHGAGCPRQDGTQLRWGVCGALQQGLRMGLSLQPSAPLHPRGGVCTPYLPVLFGRNPITFSIVLCPTGSPNPSPASWQGETRPCGCRPGPLPLPERGSASPGHPRLLSSPPPVLPALPAPPKGHPTVPRAPRSLPAPLPDPPRGHPRPPPPGQKTPPLAPSPPGPPSGAEPSPAINSRYGRPPPSRYRHEPRRPPPAPPAPRPRSAAAPHRGFGAAGGGGGGARRGAGGTGGAQ